MFEGGSYVNSSDNYNWNTHFNLLLPSGFGRNATDMSYMFAGYSSNMLDLSNLDTTNAFNMSYMFAGKGDRYNYTNYILPSGFGRNATNMSYMFAYHDGDLNITNLDTSSATNMNYMFASYETYLGLCTGENCATMYNNNPIIDFPENFGSAAASTVRMFQGLNSNTVLDASTWNFENLTNANRMFYRYRGSIVNSEVLDFPNLINAKEMFYKSEIRQLNVSDWDVSKVEDFTGMFSNMYELRTLGSLKN